MFLYILIPGILVDVCNNLMCVFVELSSSFIVHTYSLKSMLDVNLLLLFCILYLFVSEGIAPQLKIFSIPFPLKIQQKTSPCR